VGIFVTLVGIIWISLVKGASKVSQIDLTDTDEQSYYKTLSVLFAIGVGTSNASMTVQAKFMLKKRKIDVLDLTADTSLFYSLVQFFFALFFFV